MRYKPNVMEMPREQLKKMQMVELELLLELDRICRKNQIKYNICGGTLIGCMRHGGFIPWDDDVDVRMLRKEYEKFKRACEKDLDTSQFFLQDFDSDPLYRWGYAKLLKTGTTYVRAGQEHLGMKNGIWVDILISDGIPNHKISAKIHQAICFFLRKILWSPVGAKVSKNVMLRFWYKMLSWIPRRVPVAVISYLARRYNFDKCNTFRSLTFPQIHGLKKEWFVDLAEMNFEGHKVLGPRDAHGWLTQEYGDYMKMPPVDQQTGHNTASYYDF